MHLAGIDYGSKMAGTTVIAFYKDGEITFCQSEKKKDADKFLINKIAERGVHEIFLDAPLSLPGIYTNLPDCDDYFYRKGDRTLRAMSPMFLGALTARAIKFKDFLEQKQVNVKEIYPAALSKFLGLKEIDYKGNRTSIPACLNKLKENFNFKLDQEVTNWHQYDALLAVCSGLRYKKGEHIFVGDEEEGGIIY